MDSLLPATGTAKLLDLLDPHIPDDFIKRDWQWRPARGRGQIQRRPTLAAASAGAADPGACVQPVADFTARAAALARLCPLAQPATLARCAHAP